MSREYVFGNRRWMVLTMAVINYHIRLGCLVRDNPQASHAVPHDLLKENRAAKIAMAQQSPTKEGIGHPFGEEHSPNRGVDAGERISDTADNDILEKSCVASEWRPPLRF